MGPGDGAGDGARLQDAPGSLSKWPFFRTVLSNMAQVIAKADMGLAARICRSGRRRIPACTCFGKIVESTIDRRDVQADQWSG